MPAWDLWGCHHPGQCQWDFPCLPLPQFPLPQSPLIQFPLAQPPRRTVGARHPSPGTSSATSCTGVAKFMAQCCRGTMETPPQPQHHPQNATCPSVLTPGPIPASPPRPNLTPTSPRDPWGPPGSVLVPPSPAETGAARDSGAQALHQPAQGAAWAEHRLPRAGSEPLPGPNSEKYSGASNSSDACGKTFSSRLPSPFIARRRGSCSGDTCWRTQTGAVFVLPSLPPQIFSLFQVICMKTGSFVSPDFHLPLLPLPHLEPEPAFVLGK